MNKFAEFREKMAYTLFAPHLEKGEKILMVAHRHPFLMIYAGIKVCFLHFFLPIFFGNVFPEIWFVFVVWMCYGFIAFYKMIFNWYFDTIVITDKSLIDVKWNGLFDRSSVRMEYSMIESTSFSLKGILQTIFNFGTIQVMRQGGMVGIELNDAINPSRVESVIINFQQKHLSDINQKEIKTLKNLLSQMVKKHMTEMNDQGIEVDF